MIHREDIIHAARSLRWIFWGALLVVFDATYTWTPSGEDFSFDLLSDTVGWALIAVAVYRLRDIRAGSSYANRMTFIYWVSILMLLQSVMQHFVFEPPSPLELLTPVLGIATLVAILSFCACMRDVCREAMLSEAAREWHRMFVLFFAIYGVPCGLLLIVTLAAMMTGQTFQLDLSPGIWFFGALFFLSLVCFFRATSTMARSAEAMPFSPPEAPVLPLAAVLHDY